MSCNKSIYTQMSCSLMAAFSQNQYIWFNIKIFMNQWIKSMKKWTFSIDYLQMNRDESECDKITNRPIHNTIDHSWNQISLQSSNNFSTTFTCETFDQDYTNLKVKHQRQPLKCKQETSTLYACIHREEHDSHNRSKYRLTQEHFLECWHKVTIWKDSRYKIEPIM